MLVSYFFCNTQLAKCYSIFTATYSFLREIIPHNEFILSFNFSDKYVYKDTRCRPFFQLSYFIHSAPLIYAKTSLVLHFGKKISIKLVTNFLDNFQFCRRPSSRQPAPNLYMSREVYDQTQSKKIKIFFEGDIIRHLLWGRHEINIEFLNLGQHLTSVYYKSYKSIFNFT